MKNISGLIISARRATENEDVDEANNIGIKDVEFIQYLNDAQYRLQSLIVQQHPDVFSAEVEIACDGSEKYDLVAAAPLILINNKVTTVEYSSTGRTDDYYILEETNLRNRSTGSEGSPLFYIRSSGNVIPVARPSSGKLRVTYTQRVKELKKSTDTISSEGGAFDATKHIETPELPEIAERYLLSYVEWKILKRDSSVDSPEAFKELQSMELDIVKSYRHIRDDIQTIPIINQWDDWSLF